METPKHGLFMVRDIYDLATEHAEKENLDTIEVIKAAFEYGERDKKLRFSKPIKMLRVTDSMYKYLDSFGNKSANLAASQLVKGYLDAINYIPPKPRTVIAVPETLKFEISRLAFLLRQAQPDIIEKLYRECEFESFDKNEYGVCSTTLAVEPFIKRQLKIKAIDNKVKLWQYLAGLLEGYKTNLLLQ